MGNGVLTTDIVDGEKDNNLRMFSIIINKKTYKLMVKKLFTAFILLFIVSTVSCNGNKLKQPGEIETKSVDATDMRVEASIENDQISEAKQEVAKNNDSEDGLISEKIVVNNLPTVIDFNATWCGPCKKMKPIFERLAKEFKGKYNFVSIDIDKFQEIAEKYKIQAVPTFIILDEDGIEVNRITGAVPESDLRKELSEQI